MGCSNRGDQTCVSLALVHGKNRGQREVSPISVEIRGGGGGEEERRRRRRRGGEEERRRGGEEEKWKEEEEEASSTKVLVLRLG